MHVCVSFICKCVRYFNYDHTATQQSHTSLENVQAGTWSSYSSSSLLALNLIMVSNRPIVYWTFLLQTTCRTDS
jgi:hypothetical protein